MGLTRHAREQVELLSLSQQLAGLLAHPNPDNEDWAKDVRKAWKRIADLWTSADTSEP